MGHDVAFIGDVAHLFQARRIEKKGRLGFTFSNLIHGGVSVSHVGEIAFFLHRVFGDAEAFFENEPVEDNDVQCPLFLRQIRHERGEIQ